MDTLRRQFLQHVAQTSDNPLLVEVERAEGIYFYTPGGKRYVDLISGVSVSNIGHGNRQVVEAIQRQAGEYLHVMVYGELVERPQVRLARKLTENLSGTGLDSVYFVNSGAEAVEGALKLAKRLTGRTQMWAFERAYHGSTHGPMSLSADYYGGKYGPLLPDVNRLRFNCLDDLLRITGHTACVIVEPVQGEAGVRLPEPGFLEALRERCTAVGAVLIFDEIQTGMGRTGALFAFGKLGVTPDILCLAKALGGGMPLGAFIAPTRAMHLLRSNPALGHITTFGGHPVCCAAGLAAMEYIETEGLTEKAEAKGALFERLLADHPAVREVRRSGLLLAIELGDAQRLRRAMELLLDAGFLSDWFLYCDTAFRISPPLTITPEQITTCCTHIREKVLDNL